jgi:histidinol-phosphate/aromatic aminotransferase/cobyric acid decarboxylase-like protein
LFIAVITDCGAEHDGVKPENILLGAGSGEILDVVGTTFLLGNRKVVGVEPPTAMPASSAWSTSATPTTRPVWS